MQTEHSTSRSHCSAITFGRQFSRQIGHFTVSIHGFACPQFPFMDLRAGRGGSVPSSLDNGGMSKRHAGNERRPKPRGSGGNCCHSRRAEAPPRDEFVAARLALLTLPV